MEKSSERSEEGKANANAECDAEMDAAGLCWQGLRRTVKTRSSQARMPSIQEDGLISGRGGGISRTATHNAVADQTIA